MARRVRDRRPTTDLQQPEAPVQLEVPAAGDVAPIAVLEPLPAVVTEPPAEVEDERPFLLAIDQDFLMDLIFDWA